jgi:hypothetical protein
MIVSAQSSGALTKFNPRNDLFSGVDSIIMVFRFGSSLVALVTRAKSPQAAMDPI